MKRLSFLGGFLLLFISFLGPPIASAQNFFFQSFEMEMEMHQTEEGNVAQIDQNINPTTRSASCVRLAGITKEFLFVTLKIKTIYSYTETYEEAAASMDLKLKSI